MESVEELNFFPGINLEGLYNREALEYLPDYGIETLQTMIRGRIRYKVKLIYVHSILLNEKINKLRKCLTVVTVSQSNKQN